MVDLAILTYASDIASTLFTLMGALFIALGGLAAMLQIFEGYFYKAKSKKSPNQIRKDFAGKIIFGLEFFIAADILRTIQTPAFSSLINLGVIVIIRVMLGFILEREMK